MKRFTWAAPVALSLVAASAIPASAQPAPPPVPTGEDPVTGPGGYPMELVERPLMLPSSLAEVDVHLTLPTSEGTSLFDVAFLTLAGRYSTGSFEPFAGLDLLVIQPEGSNASLLNRLFAGARAPVGPGYARATASRLAPVEGYTDLNLDARFEYKQKLAPKLALVAEGGAGAEFISIDGGAGMDLSGNIFYVVGRGAGQAQLAPAAAIQGGLELLLPIAHGGDITDTNTVTTLFGEAFYSMGKFDIFARLEIVIAGDSDRTNFILGALARPM